MRASFDVLGKKNCGGGGERGTGPMLPILQPCFMTLIQFVLHTEFSNFLIPNIIEYDLLRLLFFGTTHVDHIILKASRSPPKKQLLKR